MQIAIIVGIIVFLGFLLTAVKARTSAIVGIANVANTWKRVSMLETFSMLIGLTRFKT
jgi:hypothetical protein